MVRIWTFWMASCILAANFFSTSATHLRPPTFGMRKLAFATNQFGLDILRAMRVPETEDVAMCPICISTILAVILLGAQGKTAYTLQDRLCLTDPRQYDIHAAFHDILSLLSHLQHDLPMNPGLQNSDPNRFRQDYGSGGSSSTCSKNLELHIINRICVQRDNMIHYSYQKNLHNLYNMSIHKYDFGPMYGEESRQHMNVIIEKLSKENIKNIIAQPLPKTTSILLLSALSICATLDPSEPTELSQPEDHRHNYYPLYPAPSMQHYGSHHFESNYPYQQTHSRLPPLSASSYYAPSFAPVAGPYAAAPSFVNHNFYNSHSRTRKGGLRHGQYDYLGCTAVEIPFKNRLLSLLLLVPSDSSSIGMLEMRLNAQHLSDILSTMQSKHVILEMPPISLEDSPKNLTQALFRSGLVDLFTPGFAELSGMSDNRWLHITNLIHKIKVNIKMSSNAHSTTPPSGQETIHMSLQERPFLFFVIENISGLVISMGKIAVKR